MFLSYYKLAEQGNYHIAEMRRALAQTRKTGVGWPLFGPNYLKYFEQLDSVMATVEQAKAKRRPKKLK
jgi:hypothetical protein